VVVVGAGAAGLTAARALREGTDAEVVVVDKARGVGGRMATRRLAGGATGDSGAQFFTARDPAFAATVADWHDAGVAAPWFAGAVGAEGTTGDDGHVRWRGAPGMTAVAKHLARGIDVRVRCRVTALHLTDGAWRLAVAGHRSEAGHRHDGGDGDALLHADAVVLTAPVPQALELLAAGGVALPRTDQAALRAVRYDPCLTGLVPLGGDARLPDPGALAPTAGALTWIAENRRKGVSATPTLTLHAGPTASRAHWDEPPDAVLRLLWDAAVAAGVDGRAEPLLEQAHVHRWRYARPTTLHEGPCLAVDLPAPLVLAGDAFSAARVEGAITSGAAAARAVAALLPG
jgi:renalase